MKVRLPRRLAVVGAALALAGAAQVATATQANAQSATLDTVATIFDLSGTYDDGTSAFPVISNVNDILTVDMSRTGRPNATGVVVNSDTIVVTFPDDATYGAKLESIGIGKINWSNGTSWTKVVPTRVPNVIGLTVDDAVSQIRNSGFTVRVIAGRRDLTCERDFQVFAQSPAGGTLALPRTLIAITYHTPC